MIAGIIFCVAAVGNGVNAGLNFGMNRDRLGLLFILVAALFLAAGILNILGAGASA